MYADLAVLARRTSALLLSSIALLLLSLGRLGHLALHLVSLDRALGGLARLLRLLLGLRLGPRDKRETSETQVRQTLGGDG